MGREVPIFDASTQGDLALVQAIIQADPSAVNAVDAYGCTPLDRASYAGHHCVAKLLLVNGAKPDHGRTALWWACRGGQAAVVELLLKHGADIAGREKVAACEVGCHAVGEAARAGFADVLTVLLKHGGKPFVNAPNTWGQTPLWSACFHGHAQVARLLLGAGADPTIADRDGVSPLETAIERGHGECARILQDWERCYALARVRRVSDDVASVGTSHESQHEQPTNPDASPPSPVALKRVEDGLRLPEVQWVKGEEEEGGEGEGEGAGPLPGLVDVVREAVEGLGGEVFDELLGWMGVRGGHKEGGRGPVAIPDRAEEAEGVEASAQQ